MLDLLILPDTAAAAAVRTRTSSAPPRVVPHASGRPWLVGDWPDGRLTLITAGPVRVAVIGDVPPGAFGIAEGAARVTELAELDRLAGQLPCSAHLVASCDGRVRAQGSISGLSRLFRTRIDGVDVASTRADVLARITGAAVDEQALAVRVFGGLALAPPLNELPMWDGITPLAPGHFLMWTDGNAEERPWWRPPAAHLSLRDGAEGVREALSDAVRDRLRGPGRTSADLSGGMDSTSLSFLAARHAPALLTVRWAEADAANDDASYAGRAMAELAGAEHLVLPQAELPSVFELDGIPAEAEQPLVTTRAAARLSHTAQLLARHGSVRHLAGHGGDELFQPLPGHLAPLLRRRPLLAVRRLRENRALRRWPLLPTLAGVLRPGTVESWWRAQAENLAVPPRSRVPALGWGVHPVHIPPWITPAGLDLVRQSLRGAAAEARPLSEDLGQHQTLLALRTTAASCRLIARIFGEHGVRLELPFYDQRVIEAVLRVHTAEHADPRRYKPLLAEAMRQIVPPQILGRATKGEFGQDLRDGLQRRSTAILGLFTDSMLAERGLIDTDALRTAMASPRRDHSTVFALEALVGCELWLRTTTPAPAT